MFGHRHSYPRRAVREALKAYLRRNWKPLGAGIACFLATGLGLSLILSGYLLGLGQGVLMLLASSWITQSFLLVSGTSHQLAGAWGEDNTRDVLKTARRRREIFGSIDGLEIIGGDVDHVVCCPMGVLAVDSKWHGRGITRATIERDSESAQRGARRAASIMRSLHQLAPVTPVVVIWGAGQHEVPPGHREGGVHFVGGKDFKLWLREHASAGNQLNESQSRSLLRDLESFRRRVSPSQQFR